MVPDTQRNFRFNICLWILAAALCLVLFVSLASRSYANPSLDNFGQWIQPQQHYGQVKYKKRRAARHKRTIDANGNRASRRAPHWVDPTGRMVQVETVQGYKLTVHPAYASKFLKFFALLKERGFHPPKSMVGCYSRAHKRGSNHAIGAACDIQTGWNRTVSFMYGAAEPLIRAAGLYSGCAFRDCGHVEAVRGLFNKSPNLYAALQRFKEEQAIQKYAGDFEMAAEAVNTKAPFEINHSAKRHASRQ